MYAYTYRCFSSRGKFPPKTKWRQLPRNSDPTYMSRKGPSMASGRRMPGLPRRCTGKGGRVFVVLVSLLCVSDVVFFLMKCWTCVCVCVCGSHLLAGDRISKRRMRRQYAILSNEARCVYLYVCTSAAHRVMRQPSWPPALWPACHSFCPISL